MKAITTRHVPATAHKPTRISASDQDGNRILITVGEASFPYTAHHRIAARALCDKLHWRGGDTLIGGSIKGGMVWVFPEVTP